MASKKELRALIVLAGKIDPSLQSAMLKASGESMKLSKSLKDSSKHASRLGDIIKGSFVGNLAANAVSNLTGKILELAEAGIKMSSDLIEVQNVVDTTFGKGSAQINTWSKGALNAFGLSELQAKQFSGTMGAMLKSSGLAGNNIVKMSENLTGLAGDLASFYNLSQEDAFEKIQSGIAGEIEPLRQLGINMTIANLSAYALAKGIKTPYQQMDQASQTILRYNYLLDNTKDAQGDFSKTSGSFANQMRLFDTNLKQTASTLAQKALPPLTELLQKANDWMTNTDLTPYIQQVGKAFETMGSWIKWATDHSDLLIGSLEVAAGLMVTLKVAGVISSIISLYRDLSTAIKGAAVAQDALNTAQATAPMAKGAGALGTLGAAGAWGLVAGGVMYGGMKVTNAIEGTNRKPGALNNNPLPSHDYLHDPKYTGHLLPNPKNTGHNASGTNNWRGGLSWVGERGPELLNIPRGSQIIPNNKINGLKAAGATISNYIYITAGGNAQEIAEAAKEAISGVIEQYFEDKARGSYA